MTVHLDAATVEPAITWHSVMDAIVDGHACGEPRIDDVLLRRGDDSLLSRAALIDGLGSLVKTATVFPGNTDAGRPAVNGTVSLFSDTTGEVDATVDFHLLTKWKTAADSALAASRLARSDSERILIVGSGTVAASMIDAYRSVFPDASITIWSRTHAHAERLAASTGATATDELAEAVGGADVICAATMAREPIVLGKWLQSGQHVDLIGGFHEGMREADDDAMSRASVFVDSCVSAMDVGDIASPLADDVITVDRLVDFAGLSDGSFARSSDDQITICKNAGGAHLDLMVARHMHDLAAVASRKPGVRSGS